nr:hypothetical protein [uncultured Psychroserpens sp.]|tara:strand:+ start:120 stop:401 length:282 start_codon:yes stop_codon:yes gene_type:complete
MNRKIIAILFSVLFVALITAPSIIIAIDDSVDVSIFYSITEEEEKETLKVFPMNELNEEDYFLTSNSNDNLGYFFKNYLKPHLNIISPPPDFI